MRAPRKEIVHRKRLEKNGIVMGIYTTALSTTVFTHKSCGHKWEGKPEYTKSCPNCRDVGRTLSMKEWQERTNEFRLLNREGPYFEAECISCHKVTRKHRSTIGVNGCKHCATAATAAGITVQYGEMKKRLARALPSVKPLETSYVGMAVLARFNCILCKQAFDQTPSSLIRRPHCPHCQSRFYMHKGMRMEGYESAVYEYLLSTGVRKRHLLHNSSGKVPRVEMGGKRCFHKPDFYDTRTHTLVECKSVWTLTMNAEALKRVKANERAAVKAGYKYQVVVMLNETTRVILPEAWRRYTFLRLRLYLKRSAPRHQVPSL